ncbi:MAG: 2-C-methyl-D-erythritol 4-phosphate cytidylyltransferase [Frankia sp.]
MTRVVAIVPAAGKGLRLGGGVPKALRLLGGRPLLVHAVEALQRAALVDDIVVAAPPSEVELAADLLGPSVRVVEGGAERVDSCRRALEAVTAAVDVVLVHDAARALTPSALIDAVAAAVLAGAPAVIPVVAVTDTVREVDPTGRVVRTPDRSLLRAVQTPQGFRRDVLSRAYALEGLLVTDDAGMVEALGVEVTTVPGDGDAFKVTTPADLVLAEALLAARQARPADQLLAARGSRPADHLLEEGNVRG